MRQRLNVGAREVPGKAFATGSDAELAFGQIHEFDPGFESETERTEAAVRIDAITVELTGTASSEDEDRARKEHKAEGLPGRRPGRTARTPRPRRDGPSHLGQDLHNGGVVEERDVEADLLLGQHLHHQPRGSRPAARGPSDLVVVGPVAQRAAERVLGQRQAEILQRGHHP